MANKKTAKKKFSSGSTLILAVVLTSMLAIIGTLFVLVSRVDRISTSAITEDKEIEYAVESIIAKLSEELILDIPGMSASLVYQDYYDYPDFHNAWLASLEPDVNNNVTPPVYYWRQISDVTGFLTDNFGPTYNKGWSVSNVEVRTVGDNEKISSVVLDPNGNLYTPPIAYSDPYYFADLLAADADGDGVSDSKWIQLDSTTNKGKPIFAAVRVVDNCGMLNVNTAYKFDPNSAGFADANKVDGSSQMQVNLLELSRRDRDLSFVKADNKLQSERFGAEPNSINSYQKDVVWRYNVPPVGKYTPFDVGDELKLRNRYILNYNKITTRIEELWDNAYDGGLEVPRTGTALSDPCGWFWYANNSSLDPNIYDYRHISTTYNVDQTIANTAIADVNAVFSVKPMININKRRDWIRDANPNQDEVYDLYRALVSSIDPNLDPCMIMMDPGVRWDTLPEQYAQLTANIVDFADDNNQVTILNVNDVNYFGYEVRPYISEIGMIIHPSPETGLNYFALELYNPSIMPIKLNQFSIELINREDANGLLRVTFDNDDVIYPGSCFVVANRIRYFLPPDYDPTKYKQDPNLRFFDNWQAPDKTKPPVVIAFPQPSTPYTKGPDKTKPPSPVYWGTTYDLLLKRWIDTGNLDAEGKKIFTGIYVDKQYINPTDAYANANRYFGRDARGWHIAYQTIVEDSPPKSSLGKVNSIAPGLFEKYNHRFSFLLPDLFGVTYRKFVTVGDVPRVLMIGDKDDYAKLTVGERLMNIQNEAKVRLDLRNPYYRNIFQYLTVFDPRTDGIDNNGDGVGIGDEVDSKERAVPGRININTAPWYVIAQLPWMTPAKAKAIVAYRDKLEEPVNYSGDMGRTYAVAYNNQEIRLPTYTPPVGGTPKPVPLREELGFASIGELNFVVAPDRDLSADRIYEPSMHEEGIDGIDLGTDSNDNKYGYPDLTVDGLGTGDGVLDDFEEKDIIFSRISNLVTVRSDLFTAYILVRIGADGPQKRAIAILDRSNVTTSKDKVKLVALHYVPDPR